MTRKAKHVQNLTLKQYHARPEWSRSQMEDLRQSAPLFHGRHIADPPTFPFKRSLALDHGTVAHECLSNPAGLDGVCAEIPLDVLNKDGHRRGSAWTDWRKEHAGLIHLKAEEIEPIKMMVRNTYANPIAGKLLAEVMHYEYSLVWTDEESGLPCRARPDLICPGDRGRVLVVDFKTTRAVSLDDFQRDTVKFGYHRQAAWYCEAVRLFGHDVEAFLFISVDKTPAHEVFVHRLSSDALQLGHEENQLARLELARRLAENDWTNPASAEIHELDLPAWAYPPLEIVSKGQTITV